MTYLSIHFFAIRSPMSLRTQATEIGIPPTQQNNKEALSSLPQSEVAAALLKK